MKFVFYIFMIAILGLLFCGATLPKQYEGFLHDVQVRKGLGPGQWIHNMYNSNQRSD